MDQLCSKGFTSSPTSPKRHTNIEGEASTQSKMSNQTVIRGVLSPHRPQLERGTPTKEQGETHIAIEASRERSKGKPGIQGTKHTVHVVIHNNTGVYVHQCVQRGFTSSSTSPKRYTNRREGVTEP